MMSADSVLPVKLPDEVIEATRQLLHEGEGYQWRVGDHLAAVVDGFGHVLKRSEVIRQLANGVGADASTLRDRECMARFYPPSLRREYDSLTYHQLRACKSAGERWREYADWALDNLPAPVSLIRASIKHNGDLPPAWVGRWERMLVMADLLVVDEQTPPVVRLAAVALIETAKIIGPVGHGEGSSLR